MKLIVEMELPTSCAECPVCDYEEADCLLADDRNTLPHNGERPYWCPIKGVLPDEHGDLIDRDFICNDIQLWKSTATDTITMGFLYHIEKLLMCARPIIAAAREDDE